VSERNLAAELSLLATEVDSLAKALALANAERAREADRRVRAEATAEELRGQLRHARRRAKAAERELTNLSSSREASEHAARTRERELKAQVKHLQQANDLLQHEVVKTEGARRALEQNLRELLGNLRQAAQEARGPGLAPPVRVTEEATLVSGPPDIGW
jgi:chromosome segregation ATPase